MIAIVDYGLGNLNSIKNMLNKIGVDSAVTSAPQVLKSATSFILPGVGAFDAGMRALSESGLIPILEECVLSDRVPVLGICLGAQLLTNRSEEGNLPGLGWIDAETVRFDDTKFCQDLAIPHMGWSDVRFDRRFPLVSEYSVPDPRFYFVHSYHIQAADNVHVLAAANYGFDFTAAICRDNIVGAQFHPEKSHKFGMEFLRCFARFHDHHADTIESR